MVKMLGDTFGNILAGRKSVTDIMKQSEQEERMKRAQAMQEELSGLQLEKARKDAKAPTMPFEGTGFDSQVGNIAYEKFLRETGDPMVARQMAADAVLGTKVDYAMVTDPYTGQSIPVAKQRAGIFGAANTPAINPNAPHPLDDPMAAHEAAVLNRRVNMPQGDIQPMPMQLADVERQLGVPEAQVSQDQMFNMPVGGVMSPSPSQPPTLNIDPRALASPDVQKDLARKQGEQELAANDPKFLAEQKAEADKAVKRDQMRAVGSDVIQRNVRNILGELSNPSTFPKTGMMAPVLAINPSTGAGKVNTYLTPLKNMVVLENMKTLKESSPTGATGFGSQTEKEGTRLEENLASLSLMTDPVLFEENMKTFHNDYMNLIHGTPEQIMRVGREKGLPEDVINELSFRYPVKQLDPYGRPTESQPSASGWQIRKLD